MQAANCLNCGQSLGQGSAFCPACGQKTAIHRISFHELWHDVLHYFTHADKGIFHLYRELASRPGVVAREYIEGKRTKHFKPLNFWLIVVGVLVFVSSSFYKLDDKRSQNMEQQASGIQDPVKKQRVLAMAERTRNVAKIAGKYSNVINMTAIPFLSFFFWLCYKKGKYNYTEHLVANMYFVGYIMTFYSLIFLPLKTILPDISSIIVLGIFFLFEVIYRGYAYYQLMGKTGAKAMIRAFGISLGIWVIWFSITGFFTFYYIRHGF